MKFEHVVICFVGYIHHLRSDKNMQRKSHPDPSTKSEGHNGHNSRRCEDGDPVVVLGGGVMGLSTAWTLARSGVKAMRHIGQLIDESGSICRIL